MKRLFIILLIIISTGCATTKLSPLQMRSIQSRELEGTFDNAFKATLQVFQDYGYVVKNTDYKAGVIQGETGIKRDFWWGTMSWFEMTATLEQFGENTVKERLSLILKKKSSSQYGTQEASSIVDDVELFKKIYDDIQKEIFVRKNLSK